EALVPNDDEFDDGMSIAGNRLKIGDTTTVIIYVRTNNPGGRWTLANPKKMLYFNGYFDFDTSKTFTSSDLEIWLQGVPGATDQASDNFAPAASNMAANPMKLVFHVTVPDNTPVCTTWARMRLDYGEDEGRVNNINGDLGPAVGVAQFGEVEDYQVT